VAGAVGGSVGLPAELVSLRLTQRKCFSYDGGERATLDLLMLGNVLSSVPRASGRRLGSLCVCVAPLVPARQALQERLPGEANGGPTEASKSTDREKNVKHSCADIR